ncbi:MAG: Dyp-type peroxidase [Hydrogenophaga sp.]|uniref:Dyp-type peroxidase n=1 Tax=Hydrogenophaga sp. TaxID=1904254 RepID=UPI00272311C3|nr:Dyp-type peroxidase [Hydrogenophaga sp.]MDO9480032.1 Dyp-type peroxidase [Hydrogenophaga sp.]MDP3343144.1 Dyp-type peroxidase [Hydrogenophaga sp.]MDP3807246.1 Dyp-type peroxidase [Hydrogenophaga sp.]MDZ4125142.1 Dyp-type peroxidase [Hydrogenophaga sp.]
MSLSTRAQPGILANIPAQARYLTCQLRVGAEPQTVLRHLASQADGEHTVIGLGASLVRELGASIPGLKSFQGIDGARIKLPATPADLWIWLRGNDRGELLIRSRHLETLLAPAFDVQHITDAFNHDNGKDLTGYEDGTENPQGGEAHAAALVPESAGPLAGSSFVAVQRWHHHMSRFEAMPRLQQDHTIGRDKDSNEELDDAPNSAHVKRTAQESFDPQAFVLRRSMPWAEGNVGGLVFTAFGHSFDAFEALLGRMSGAEDGMTDALFTFTEPQTGAYFWCPPVANGCIDLRAVGF